MECLIHVNPISKKSFLHKTQENKPSETHWKQDRVEDRIFQSLLLASLANYELWQHKSRVILMRGNNIHKQ